MFLKVVVILLAEAVPKKILDLMNVEKLTRENVASHLQVNVTTCDTLECNHMFRCIIVVRQTDTDTDTHT